MENSLVAGKPRWIQNAGMLTHIVFTALGLIAVFRPGAPGIFWPSVATVVYGLHWAYEFWIRRHEPRWKAERRRNREWCEYLQRSLKTAADPVHREALEDELSRSRAILLQR